VVHEVFTAQFHCGALWPPASPDPYDSLAPLPAAEIVAAVLGGGRPQTPDGPSDDWSKFSHGGRPLGVHLQRLLGVDSQGQLLGGGCLAQVGAKTCLHTTAARGVLGGPPA
jgi:hypothetical protein